MFALGLLSWLYNRPTEGTEPFLETKFAAQPEILEANLAALQAGWNYGETTEDFAVAYEVKPAPMPAGHLPQHHRQPRAGLRPGRRARSGPACRCSSAPTRSPRPPTSCTSCPSTSGSACARSRPRTRSPASARRSARRSAARSASPRPPARASRSRPRRSAWPCRSSCRWSSSTSSAAGPRPACRPRPSRPTCCRRCSAATASRRCRSSPRSSPADCFDAAIEAVRIATTYRTPVFLLSDGYLANGSEPWRIPDVDDLPDLRGRVRDRAQRHRRRRATPVFQPYLRDPETLARPWAVPGTPGLEHRIGGIEKADGTGNISYDPDNHDLMVRAAPGQDRRDRRDHPAARGRRPDRRRRRAGARLGLDLRPDRARPPGWSATPAARSPRPTCATSTRSRPTPARCCAATTRSSSRR